MPKRMWLVTVEATVRRTYEVEAENEKAALDASVDVEPIAEDELCAETISVVPCEIVT